MPTTPQVATTRHQRGILRAALGLDMSREPYRNRYSAVVGGDDAGTIDDLVALGLMEWGDFANGGHTQIAHVTAAGRAEVMP